MRNKEIKKKSWEKPEVEALKINKVTEAGNNGATEQPPTHVTKGPVS